MASVRMDEKQELIQAIQRIAEELGTKTVPRREFLRQAGASERKVQRLFGSYNGLVEAAGLEPRNFPTSEAPTYSDQEMLDEIVRVLRMPEAKLTRVFFDQNAKISSSACERRFGGWIKAIQLAAALLNPESDGSLLARVQEYVGQPQAESAPIPAGGHPIEENVEQTEEAMADGFAHQFIATAAPNVYGDFINFRGLQHAPLNEQGVVFLFGMICREIGYVVEIVKPGFPDCEAKRRIKGRPGVWQRVRIEFEFQSRNFRAHGHDPNQCDVIVCWEDNWPDCPIEVLELRSVTQNLSSVVASE